jgi:crotonobetainyl-CoA:carnitine CoA-transferase CaiB-like acyl-CoA transferase
VPRIEPEQLPDIATDADVGIETLPPGRLDELGLGCVRLRVTNPRLVLTSLTPFGQTGPYAGYHGEELVAELAAEGPFQ